MASELAPEGTMKAARAFLDKVKTISQSEEVKSIYVTACIHGVNYRGPNWKEEADNLDALLRQVE